MKAMVVRAYGEPDAFEYAELETPRPKADEVLVRVRGSGVNPFDCTIRSGALKAFIRLRLPAVLGVDLAGEVAEVGRSVSRFKPGDRVYAYVAERGGGYGEFAAVPESLVARAPKNVRLEEAGVVPGVALTAHEAFTKHAQLKRGDRVLIVGAAGGVGSFAVQVAKAFGARVTGVCSGPKAAFVEGLGADAVVDYTTSDPLELRDRFDVILYAVRDGRQGKFRRLLKARGRIVVLTHSPFWIPVAIAQNLVSRRKNAMFYVKGDGKRLDEVTRLIEEGRVRVAIHASYSWRELGRAHQECEAGRTLGKIAVRIGA